MLRRYLEQRRELGESELVLDSLTVDDVMRLFAAFASVYAKSRSRLVRYGFINGLPGFVTIERGGILQTTALEIEHGGVVAIYVVRNPDKLRHIADTLH